MLGRTCTKCHLEKSANSFEKNGKMPNGSIRLRSICKDCGSRIKLERPEARVCTVCHKKKSADEFLGRSSWCRPCKNEATYAYKRGPGRAAHNARMVEYNRARFKNDPTYKLKHYARQAVIIAVKLGLLKRPTRCPTCNRKTQLQGHHYKGYDKKHWLNVKWLCARCHYKEEHT